MNVKPIKRNTNLVPLSRDHHHTLLFCWKLRTGVRLNVELRRINAYVQYFWQNHMEPHFKDEENVLFASIEPDVIQRAVDEHRSIAQGVGALQIAHEVKPEKFLDLAELVERHVRYEERELFPLLESLLTEPQLEFIGRQVTAHAHTFAEYFDNFWVDTRR